MPILNTGYIAAATVVFRGTPSDGAILYANNIVIAINTIFYNNLRAYSCCAYNCDFPKRSDECQITLEQYNNNYNWRAMVFYFYKVTDGESGGLFSESMPHTYNSCIILSICPDFALTCFFFFFFYRRGEKKVRLSLNSFRKRSTTLLN